MEKIKVMIVEDQLLIAADMKTKLEEESFEVTGIVSSGEEAIRFVHQNIPDIIIMDIHLSGAMDGISAAEKITEQYAIPVVYLSDHVDPQTVNRAKKTNPANYLSKPFKKSDLIRALELAFYNVSYPRTSPGAKLSDRILVRTDQQTYEMITYADILFLEAARAYCYIQTIDKKYTLSNSMKKVFNNFESQHFVRVHRSFVININRISGIEGNIIKMGNYKVHMSSDFRSVLMGKIGIVK